MTTRADVIGFLRSHPDQEFCETCLQIEIGLGGKVRLNEIIRYLSSVIRSGRLGFYRQRGCCLRCGKNRLVIRAASSPVCLKAAEDMPGAER